MIKFIDLFAGIGGTRIGFEEACKELSIKFECVFSSEIDLKATQTYEMNFGEKPQGDIRLIENIPSFDFLLAGFPCQPFSYAGKQKGFGDTRGTLFFEIERILKKYKPKGFLLENVRGLTTHDQGRTLETIVSTLQDIGYKVTYRLLNSSNFGVPQNRIRVYIIGLLNEEPNISIKSNRGASDSHKYKSMQSTIFNNLINRPKVLDILEDKVDNKYYCNPDFISQLKIAIGEDLNKLAGKRLIDYRNGHSIHSWEIGLKGNCTVEEIEFMNKLIENRRKKEFGIEQDGKKLTLEQIKTFYKKPNILTVIQALTKKGYLKELEGKYNPVAGNMSFEVFKFLDSESISITLVSSDAHKIGVVHNGIARKITPRECARLQGFPDSFKIHPNDIAAYRQFGNTVSVPVIKSLIKELLSNHSI